MKLVVLLFSFIFFSCGNLESNTKSNSPNQLGAILGLSQLTELSDKEFKVLEKLCINLKAKENFYRSFYLNSAFKFNFESVYTDCGSNEEQKKVVEANLILENSIMKYKALEDEEFIFIDPVFHSVGPISDFCSDDFLNAELKNRYIKQDFWIKQIFLEEQDNHYLVVIEFGVDETQNESYKIRTTENFKLYNQTGSNLGKTVQRSTISQVSCQEGQFIKSVSF